MKGGWKETRGVRRPISDETPVSGSRMASLNPFETKRKGSIYLASRVDAHQRAVVTFVRKEVGYGIEDRIRGAGVGSY